MRKADIKSRPILCARTMKRLCRRIVRPRMAVTHALSWKAVKGMEEMCCILETGQFMSGLCLKYETNAATRLVYMQSAAEDVTLRENNKEQLLHSSGHGRFLTLEAFFAFNS